MIVPPLKLYLLWHPDFEGKNELPEPDELVSGFEATRSPIASLARDLVKLLQGTNAQQLEGFQSIDVNVRNEPLADERLPKDIDPDLADLNIIIPFIDESMKADQDWRQWVQKLATAEKMVVFPVWMIKNPRGWKDLAPNAVRLCDEEVIEKRPYLLKRELMTFANRLLSGESSPNIFVSYTTETPHPDDEDKAKRLDAAKIAESLRSDVRDGAGLDCFVAHKSIPKGDPGEEVMKEALRAAFVVVTILTSNLHLSGVCRQEIQTAVRPYRLIEAPSQCWHIKPLFVIDALNHSEWSLSLQEFGGREIIRWDYTRAERLIREVVIRALTHGVFTGYTRKRAEKLIGEDRVVITWIPNSLSMVQLRELGGLPEPEPETKDKKTKVVYPGELDPSDRETLENAFNVTFGTYEELESDE